jgi:type I restriction enzyme M protein
LGVTSLPERQPTKSPPPGGLHAILVPWQAFGDLDSCQALVPEHEKALVADIERERDDALVEIKAAYGPWLAALPMLRREIAEREALSEREAPEDKDKKKAFREEKKANAERLKELKRGLKPLEKLEAEAEEKRAAACQHAEREIALARQTAAELLHLCSDPAEANRYFVVAERPEIEENEFNLHLPRYVDTFEPEEEIDISKALAQLGIAETEAKDSMAKLRTLLKFKDT